jgi:CelD/BcsL family acetyltransferase involved in cellulose biosynthesis
MPMSAFLIDPAADARWLRFLDSAAGTSIFHHPAWLQVLGETYGYAPVCIMASDDAGAAGALPLMEVRSWLTGNRAVCLPFSDTCGAITRSEEARRALLGFADTLRGERRWQYVEMRDSSVGDGYVPAARYKRHVTRLQRDPDALLQTFNQHARRKLRRARAMRVRVERRADDQAIAAFIRLNALTRRRHGVLPQPDSLFRSIQQHLLGRGLGFLGVATIGGEIVAASLFLHWKDTIVYKYGASDDRALPSAANYAVMWDALCWGCEQGFTWFDFGRSDLAGEGLLQFKRGWGSEEQDLVYARRSDAATTRANDEPGLQERLKPLISRMPLPLLKMIGVRAYPHVG